MDFQKCCLLFLVISVRDKYLKKKSFQSKINNEYSITKISYFQISSLNSNYFLLIPTVIIWIKQTKQKLSKIYKSNGTFNPTKNQINKDNIIYMYNHSIV